MPLLPLKPMGQSRHGVTQILEAQLHPLVAVIPRFIQIGKPLLSLKLMAQSWHGVTQMLEAQVLLRAAKADSVE
jgi:septum formation topological specificity factor MinE